LSPCFCLSLKITAWCLTRSVAILTDALESIVNVIAGAVGLYSLSIAVKMRLFSKGPNFAVIQ
jgi:divalent metal cation (Fe/Co/Zn/Cd) transporter